jgi:transcriptional regulator with XRE-family HTH domain
MSDIVKQLRKIRQEQKLSQDAISILGGICSKGYVAKIESGYRDPQLRTVQRYADALGYKLVLEPKE